MEKLENLKSEFQRYVDSKKWNRFMEEKSVNVFRRLVELEEKHNKSIVDIDNKYIAENIKSLSATGILFGIPSPSPIPNHPPVPIANSDCAT